MTLEQPLGLRSSRDEILLLKLPFGLFGWEKAVCKPRWFRAGPPSQRPPPVLGMLLHPRTAQPPLGRDAERGSRMPSRGEERGSAALPIPAGACQDPQLCSPPAPACCGYTPEHPRPPRGGITETFPRHRVRHLLLGRGERTGEGPAHPRERRWGHPCCQHPSHEHPASPWARGLRRGAGQPGCRAAGGGRGAAGGLWGRRCTGRCRSSGCGPPAAPAAGSDGRWHSRWSARCPGPLRSKHREGHQGDSEGAGTAWHRGQALRGGLWGVTSGSSSPRSPGGGLTALCFNAEPVLEALVGLGAGDHLGAGAPHVHVFGAHHDVAAITLESRH